MPKKTVKPAKTKNISLLEARLYILSTFNNTIITLTDTEGKTIAWNSCGRSGFKGARRSTPFAANTATERILEDARNFGIKRLSVYLNGPGTGRDAALRILRSKKDFDITQISDITPIPHNGPRPPKQRKG